MRRTLSILLSLVMLLGVMPAMPVQAESAVKETRYQLVTACINVWKNSSGAWQAGVKPGADKVYNGAISKLELTGDFDRSKVSNVRFYNNKAFDPAFDFSTKNFAWSNSSGVWQKGIEAGKVYNKPSTTVYDIGALYPKEKVENVTAYPYELDFDLAKLG